MKRIILVFSIITIALTSCSDDKGKTYSLEGGTWTASYKALKADNEEEHKSYAEIYSGYIATYIKNNKNGFSRSFDGEYLELIMPRPMHVKYTDENGIIEYMDSDGVIHQEEYKVHNKELFTTEKLNTAQLQLLLNQLNTGARVPLGMTVTVTTKEVR